MSGAGKNIFAFKVVFWLLLGIVLRVAAGSFTFHPDSIFVNYYPLKFSCQGILDIYGNIQAGLSPGEVAWAYYPPFTYFAIGIFQTVIKTLDPGFIDFVTTVRDAGIKEYLFLNGTGFALYKDLFLMKSYLTVFDIVVLLAGCGYLKEPEMKKRFIRLWSVNPVILYGAYMFGQADIMPAACVILGLLLIKRSRKLLGILFVGSAVLFKTYAIFLLPAVLIIVSRSYREFMKYFLSVAGLIVIFVLPLYVSSGGYVVNAFFPKFYVNAASSLPVPGIDRMIFGILYLFSIYLCSVKRSADVSETLIRSCISAIMMLYVLFFVPVHYFIWAIPLLMVAVCMRMVPFWVYCLQILSLFIYNMNGELTTTWIFAPLNPRFFLNLPGVPDIMHSMSVRWGFVMLVSQMLFTALCVFVAFRIYGFFAPEEADWYRFYNKKEKC